MSAAKYMSLSAVRDSVPQTLSPAVRNSGEVQFHTGSDCQHSLELITLFGITGGVNSYHAREGQGECGV